MAALSRVHHTGLTVSDIERSIVFYRDVMGLELVSRQETDGGYDADIVGYPGARTRKAYLRVVGDTAHVIELFQYLDPVGTPLDVQSKNTGAAHLCLVVDDLHAYVELLESRGYADFVSRPIHVDAGPSQGGYALYMLDPDGIRVELLQPAPIGAD